MTDRKLKLYPLGTADSHSKAADFYDIINQSAHNSEVSHSTNKNATFAYHNSSGNLIDYVKQSPYNDTIKSYSKTSGSSNPFTKSGKLTVQGDSYDHSYGTFFEIGSGDSKLWLPDVIGVYMKMTAKTSDGSTKQRPDIRGIYGNYVSETEGSKTFKYPFPMDGDKICAHEQTKEKYGRLSTDYIKYIRQKKFKFNKLYIAVYVARDMPKSKTPQFIFERITLSMSPDNSDYRFVIPKNLRSNKTGDIKYY